MDNEEEIGKKLVVRCLAGIVLNVQLHRGGFVNKLLIDMNEHEYQEYIKFLETHINSLT